MNRRAFVRSTALGGLATIAFPLFAQQDKFPSKTIRFVVPFSAGGGGDAIARIAGQKLSERLNNPVVVENRTGAGGNVGSAYVMKSVPDGYTLLNMSTSYCIQAALAPLPFDPILDMQPIITLAQTPMVLLVHNDSPFRNATDLIAAAKKKSRPVHPWLGRRWLNRTSIYGRVRVPRTDQVSARTLQGLVTRHE